MSASCPHLVLWDPMMSAVIMVVLSHSLSLAVILSITLFTCNHMHGGGGAEALQHDVVVEFGVGQQVVLDHGVQQDRHPVRHHSLLVNL